MESQGKQYSTSLSHWMHSGPSSVKNHTKKEESIITPSQNSKNNSTLETKDFSTSPGTIQKSNLHDPFSEASPTLRKRTHLTSLMAQSPEEEYHPKVGPASTISQTPSPPLIGFELTNPKPTIAPTIVSSPQSPRPSSQLHNHMYLRILARPSIRRLVSRHGVSNVTQVSCTRYLKMYRLTYITAGRPKSLIVVGASRIGKTEWARSLGAHCYWNGYFDLATWNPSAEYAIWDDLDWSKFTQYKQWLGAQQQFTVTDKYKCKMQIQWGKPCIVLSNKEPIFPEPSWIDKNCVTVFLNSPLF